MQVFDKVCDQVQSVGLPVVAVSLTALPRANTPVLLVLHWHGFAKSQPARATSNPDASYTTVLVPGSALQLNEPWLDMEHLDHAMLQAAWQMGAWELLREERRACNTAGASEREALECRQAFAENPLEPTTDDYMLTEAPDRLEMMQLGARVGYVRWQFRPVKNGLWKDTAVDETLQSDGGRTLPCPVNAQPTVGVRVGRTRYTLGHSSQIVLL